MGIFETKKDGEQIVLAISGKLDSTTASAAETKIKSFITDDVRKVVLNFETLEYISSAGLRILLTLAKLQKKKDGEVSICCAKPVVKEVFEISGFTAIFPLFDTEDDARKS
jgi:anti-sigma B factor antagonist